MPVVSVLHAKNNKLFKADSFADLPVLEIREPQLKTLGHRLHSESTHLTNVPISRA
jgi:hypothetical protein